jgi:acetyltransferase-like isoleucine patch superfamily enzyme
MRKYLRRLQEKAVLKIGIIIQSLESKIGDATLPRFATNPRNLRIELPRRFSHPENIYIGNEVYLGPGSLLKTVTQYPGNKKIAQEMGLTIQEFKPELRIGNRVTATGGLQISALERIIIEDDVMFASNIFICDGLHGYSTVDIPFKYQPMFKIAPIIIKRGCWIGQNVVVLPGVTIGEMSIIGANSVVNQSIPDRSIAVGSPARIIKTWNENIGKWVTVDYDR